MNISVVPGLEKLAERVEMITDSVLRERDQLGLSVPERFNVQVRYFGSRYTAEASFSHHRPTIRVNAIPLVMPVFDTDGARALHRLTEYFGYVREGFGDVPDETILSIMEDSSLIDRLESSMSQVDLASLEKRFAHRGVAYGDLKEILVKTAPLALGILRNTSRKLDQAVDETDLSVLRHEMDHVDLFRAPFARVYQAYWGHARRAQRSWEERGDEESAKALAAAKMGLLKKMIVVDPVFETRALFFDQVPVGGWRDADYDAARDTVLESYRTHYIDDVRLAEMVDALVSRAWSEGRMDQKTSSFIFSSANAQSQDSRSHSLYAPDETGVDRAEAERILHEELPLWKAAMFDHAADAATVFADAYRNDPRRLRRAMAAVDVREYLDACRS